MLTIDQIDKIKKEIMWRTDITAAYDEEEIAAVIEVFELAKERVTFMSDHIAQQKQSGKICVIAQ